MDVKMEESWKEVLKHEFSKSYFLELVTFLKTEKATGKTIYPPGPLIFNAFQQNSFRKGAGRDPGPGSLS
jgi:uracil-DNA glycosylase